MRPEPQNEIHQDGQNEHPEVAIDGRVARGKRLDHPARLRLSAGRKGVLHVPNCTRKRLYRTVVSKSSNRFADDALGPPVGGFSIEDRQARVSTHRSAVKSTGTILPYGLGGIIEGRNHPAWLALPEQRLPHARGSYLSIFRVAIR